MPGAVAVRRGLPRVPGGEPWPPEGTALAPAAASPAAEVLLDEVAPAVREAPPSVPAPNAVGQAPSAPVAAPTAPGIRRGLPRVAGGEPWPLAGGAPVAHAAPVVVAAEPVASPAPQESSTAAPVEAAQPVPASVSVSVPEDAPASQGAGVLRRGLPRVAGGEPWPPSGTAPAPAVENASAFDPVPALEPAPALEPVPERPRVAMPAAAAAQPAAAPAVVEPVVVEPAVVGPAAAAPPAAAPPAAAPSPAAAPPVAAKPAAPPAARKPAAAAKAAAPAAVPSMRPVTARQWIATGVLVALAIVGAATIVVAIARWFVGLEPVATFMQQYSGTYELPEGAPIGLPPWLNWSHFFNALLIVLIIRSGLQVRYERKPAGYWTPKRGGKKTSLSVWLHTSLDVLWVVNGLVFVVLLLATGQWMRIVPTSLEVFPHAVSAGLQYASLDWPTEHGWVNYNALQQLAYFTTVFVAAPLAIITGLRMSRWWPQGRAGLDRAFPVEWARAVHFPVMLYFVVFIVTHVLLVLTTGALRNLNHMYAAREAEDWLGFALFAGSLLVIAAAWFAARPSLLVPLAQRFGTVSSR